MVGGRRLWEYALGKVGVGRTWAVLIIYIPGLGSVGGSRMSGWRRGHLVLGPCCPSLAGDGAVFLAAPAD